MIRGDRERGGPASGRRFELVTPGALTLALAAALAAGCAPAEEPAPEATGPAAGEAAEAPAPADDPATAWARSIEQAHGAGAWAAKNEAGEALSSRITVDYGGERILEGRMLLEPDLGRTRFELTDGTVVVWDGEGAWVAPAEAELPGARFHALTWPYFLALPMKLRDPGAHLEPLGEATLDGTTHDTMRLTFDPGTGDSPDDWYVVYRDAQTGRLAAAAYVVTYGRDLAAAEREPHAVRYQDYQPVESVLVPRRWTFWSWNADDGIYGEPIGEVSLSDVEWIEPPPGTFDAPEGAREDELPAAGGTAE